MKSIIKTIMGITIGISIGYIIVCNSESFYPNDFSRTSVILNALQNDDAEVLLFGNSVLMNGVDANQFSKNTLNLGSSGQRITESFLMYQEIPKNVKHVIQFVDAMELMDSSGRGLNYKTILNYVSRGYHPDSFTLSTLNSGNIKFFKNITCFDEIKFQRNQFSGSINSLFRDVFQPTNLLLENYNNVKDPFFYINNKDNNEVDDLIKMYNPSVKKVQFKFNTELLLTIIRCKYYFMEKGIQYTMVVSPIHPKMNNYSFQFYKNLNDFVIQNKDLRISNFSQLLIEEDFIDHAHPNEKGRNKMTLELKKVIN